MSRLQHVETGQESLRRLADVVGEKRYEEYAAYASRIRERLEGHVLWNVNSTAVGGGVAEMLRVLVAYARGDGVDARWLVIEGNPEFFRVTKRLHHALHGATGDGSRLGREARRIYETTLRANAVELSALVKPGDIVLLHDPQTAGLTADLVAVGAIVIWRLHIGHDALNDEVAYAWAFLEPYVQAAHACVFTREAYVPPTCKDMHTAIIRPSIDPFAAKNEDLEERTVRSILTHTGLIEGPPPAPELLRFQRADGTPGRVERQADVVRLGGAPDWETPLVVQVSRWDPLKDMGGVMHGFAAIADGGAPANAELVLAGPNVRGVTDDPEGPAVFDALEAEWHRLPHAIRKRVHLAMLPLADVEENAIMVNALQRHAAIVVQKSLREGFGLTVTEAMWKARPVVASAVGGIRDQIVHKESGWLLEDASDLKALGAALRRLLDDPAERERLGRNARQRVIEEFLGVRHLIDYARLIEDLDS